ncbi:alpha/beta hydrolase [Yinghuangia sp. ASG 101]|uniref:alpha/beta hydrolase n=1 Tax=Yinghuangia sp. ASG 101 TaxID=2896848 RepID=UPI001E3EAC46|nr:alpha/beta hydrolase [Yinghuangia sp. ASG 101]UGQ09888.1 alpha/beta hydrolase [Yinghuangia sp. ASG 101]
MTTRCVAATAALLAVAAGPVVAGPADGTPVAPVRVPAGIAWGGCPADLPPTLECGTLDVPLDHAAPDGPTTTLGVAVARATGAKRGSILVNPGGPGGEGMWLAAAVQRALPADLRASYDIVGVDPRGNGHSSPIRCVDTETFDKAPKPDPVPRTAADEQALLARAKAYADGCAARAGHMLPHLGTVANAHDLDAVRAALGEPRISYLGWSYGTYLGAVYGQLYPRRVDRLILDSVVDPRPEGIWYGANLAQDIAFQARWRDFTDWAARHDDVLGLGARADAVQEAADHVLAGVRAAPAEGVVGPAEVSDMVSGALYDDGQWPELARALRSYLDGDPSRLTGLYTPPDAAAANSTAIYTAVECVDGPWPRDWAVWKRDADALHRTHPILTWSNTWLNAPCLFWPVPAHEPVRVDGRGLSGALLIQAARDPATPLAGAAAMRQSLPTARMVTVTGDGNHGVLVFDRNECVEDLAYAYLRDGALPATDRICAAGDEPEPGQGSAR